MLDSTGLSIVGAGEWAAAKHGGCGRRGWRKLHLGVDQSGVIRVHTLTEATGDDATTALDLLNAVDGHLVRVTADAAYDTVAVYETAGQDGDRLWSRPAVARAGSDDHVGEDARPAPLEAGVRVPSSGSGGEHVLPLQVHHRRWPSRPESGPRLEAHGRPCGPPPCRRQRLEGLLHLLVAAREALGRRCQVNEKPVD